MNKKVFSQKRANSSLAFCYLEECVNKPNDKVYRYYQWDSRKRTYAKRTLIMEEGTFANYLMYQKPEYLMKLMNEGRFYLYVMRRVKKYICDVDRLTKKLCKSDEEMQLALKLGDLEKYSSLERNNHHKAEELLYPLNPPA